MVVQMGVRYDQVNTSFNHIMEKSGISGSDLRKQYASNAKKCSDSYLQEIWNSYSLEFPPQNKLILSECMKIWLLFDAAYLS